MWTWHGFNIVDGVVALVLLAGFVGGIRRGFSGELVRALVAVAAIAAAVLYTRPASEWAIEHWQFSVRAALIGSFLAVLVGAYVAATLLRTILGKLADFTFKGPLERLGGGVCGMARAAAVSGLILLLLGLAPNENLQRLVTDESAAGQLVTRHLRPLYAQLSERVPEIRLDEETLDGELPGELGEVKDVPVVQDVMDQVEYVLPGEASPGEER